MIISYRFKVHKIIKINQNMIVRSEIMYVDSMRLDENRIISKRNIYLMHIMMREHKKAVNIKIKCAIKLNHNIRCQ